MIEEASLPAPIPAVRSLARSAALTPAAESPHVPAEAASAPSQAGAGPMVIAGRGANVRSGPGLAHGKLFALAGGVAVTPTGETDHGWVHVTDPDGRDGWIYGDYVQPR
jgi:uncharacterized protein YgiM (DUF1202 family)